MIHAKSDSVIADIAREELGMSSLAVRGCDGLDFNELHVSRLKAALTRVYRAGGTASRDGIFRHAKMEASHDE